MGGLAEARRRNKRRGEGSLKLAAETKEGERWSGGTKEGARRKGTPLVSGVRPGGLR